MSISIQRISRQFEQQQVLNRISLEIDAGEFVALLGPSGCGKTTLLRIIAGLESADEGHIFLDGQNTASLPISKRQIGFVFQNYALFPSMTVQENISFGLRMLPRSQRPTTRQIKSTVDDLLTLVQQIGRASCRERVWCSVM